MTIIRPFSRFNYFASISLSKNLFLRTKPAKEKITKVQYDLNDSVIVEIEYFNKWISTINDSWQDDLNRRPVNEKLFRITLVVSLMIKCKDFWMNWCLEVYSSLCSFNYTFSVYPEQIKVKSNSKLQGWPQTPVVDWSFKSSPFLVFQSGLLFIR